MLYNVLACVDNMSVFDFLKLDNFKHRIRVDTQHCRNYMCKESTPKKVVVLTVHIPYGCLRQWHEARQKALAQSMAQYTPCAYVEIFNAVLFEKTGMRVKEDSQRIEGRLRRACSKIKSKFAAKRGRSYRKLFEKELKLAVQLDDLVTIAELEKELTTEKIKNEDLETHCEDLVKELFEAQAAERVASENLAKADEEI